MKRAFLAACAVIFVLFLLLVYQVTHTGALERKNASLRALLAQLGGVQQENQRLREAQTGLAELDTLRQEHEELLRLRGEVSRLRREVDTTHQKLKAAQAAAARAAAVAPVQESPGQAAGAPFQAVLQSRLAPNQTLLTGGWATSQGKRTYVLLSPAVASTQDGTESISVSQVLFELPESMLASVGLDAFVAEGRTSDLQGVLEAADLKALLEALTDTQAVDILSAPTVMTVSGRQAQVRITGSPTEDPGEVPTGLTVDLVPTAVAGTGEIDLKVVVQMPGK